MSDTQQSEAEAQRVFDQQIDISERFADLAAGSAPSAPPGAGSSATVSASPWTTSLR